MNVSSFLNVDNMRIEIAILQEDIDAFEPTTAAFRVPAIMTENTVAFMSTANTNIINRSNGNIGSSKINIDNNLSFFVPFEYTFAYGSNTVPKGTKFLLAFIGANVNDGIIIGRYDQSSSKIAQTIAQWIINVIDLDGREKIIINNINDNLSKDVLQKYDDEIRDIKDLILNNTESLQNEMDENKTSLENTVSRFKETLEELIHTTRVALEDKITANKQETDDKINLLNSSITIEITGIKSRLDDIVRDINEQITTNIETLRQEYIEGLNQAKTDLTSMITSVNTLVNTLKTKIENDNKTYDNQFTSIRDAIQERISADQDIIDLITSTKEFLIDEDGKIKSSLNTRIDSAISDYQSADNEINEHVDELSVSLNTLKELHEALEELVNQMDERLTKDIIDSTEDAINTAKEYTDEKISEEEQSVQDRFNKFNEDLLKEIKSLDNKITTLLYGQFTDSIQQYIAAQIESSNSYTDEEIIKAKDELTKYVDDSITIVNGVIEALTATVANNKQELEELIEERENVINERIDSEVETLLTRLSEAKAEVNARTDQLLHDMGETIANQLSVVSNKIDESCSNVSDQLTNALDRDISRVENEIDSLRSDGITNVDNTREFLLETIDNTKETLDTKLELLKTRLEQTLATYQDKTDATFKDLKKTLNDHEKRIIMLERWHDDFKKYYPSDTFKTVQDDIDTAQRTADNAYRLAVNGYCSC